MSAMLEVKDLVVSYGQIKAVKGISFTVDQGEVVCLIGTNGAGKTTTLRTISGLIRPTAGSITFEGKQIDAMPAHEIVTLGLAHSPEGRRIFPRMSVEENLLLGAYTRKDGELKGDLDAAYELFPILGERRAQPAGTFSGGEQQMLAMGRAMMSRPRLLLLDEPSTGLDPQTARDLRSLVRGLVDDGAAILLTTHDMREAEQLADRVAVIDQGRMVAHGGVPEIARSAGVTSVVSWQVPVDSATPTGALESIPGVRAVVTSERNGITTVDVLLSGAPGSVALARAAAGPGTLTGPAERPATLEEVYLALLEPVAA